MLKLKRTGIDTHNESIAYVDRRHRDSDFLYGEELAHWSSEGRLASLATACSRGSHPRHVQHVTARESEVLAAAIGAGAHVMVCGGREMASGVAETLAAILEPMGLSRERLKAEGRYVKDVY